MVEGKDGCNKEIENMQKTAVREKTVRRFLSYHGKRSKPMELPYVFRGFIFGTIRNLRQKRV